ncbi:hypothetical protein B0H11DRAFT_2251670 [Mycena galericulata]|nr:hypothetical protein B0H11DRAFT_2251670 [Mycena galericulata]
MRKSFPTKFSPKHVDVLNPVYGPQYSHSRLGRMTASSSPWERDKDKDERRRSDHRRSEQGPPRASGRNPPPVPSRNSRPGKERTSYSASSFDRSDVPPFATTSRISHKDGPQEDGQFSILPAMRPGPPPPRRTSSSAPAFVHAPRRMAPPPPLTAAEDIFAAPRIEQRSLDPKRVSWVVPPSISLPGQGKWEKYVLSSYMGTQAWVRHGKNRQPNTTNTWFDRENRRQLYFGNYPIPPGVLNASTFGAPVPRFVFLHPMEADGLWNAGSNKNGNRAVKASHWMYPSQQPKSGDSNRRPTTPNPLQLPLKGLAGAGRLITTYNDDWDEDDVAGDDDHDVDVTKPGVVPSNVVVLEGYPPMSAPRFHDEVAHELGKILPLAIVAEKPNFWLSFATTSDGQKAFGLLGSLGRAFPQALLSFRSYSEFQEAFCCSLDVWTSETEPPARPAQPARDVLHLSLSRCGKRTEGPELRHRTDPGSDHNGWGLASRSMPGVDVHDGILSKVAWDATPSSWHGAEKSAPDSLAPSDVGASAPHRRPPPPSIPLLPSVSPPASSFVPSQFSRQSEGGDGMDPPPRSVRQANVRHARIHGPAPDVASALNDAFGGNERGGRYEPGTASTSPGSPSLPSAQSAAPIRPSPTPPKEPRRFAGNVLDARSQSRHPSVSLPLVERAGASAVGLGALEVEKQVDGAAREARESGAPEVNPALESGKLRGREMFVDDADMVLAACQTEDPGREAVVETAEMACQTIDVDLPVREVVVEKIVEKVVEKIVEVPVEKTIEKIIEKIVEVPLEDTAGEIAEVPLGNMELHEIISNYQQELQRDLLMKAETLAGRFGLPSHEIKSLLHAACLSEGTSPLTSGTMAVPPPQAPAAASIPPIRPIPFPRRQVFTPNPPLKAQMLRTASANPIPPSSLSPSPPQIKKADIRSTVVKMIDAALHEATGCSTVHIKYTNYERIMKAEIGYHLVGWPEHIPMKAPSSMNTGGAESLQKLHELLESREMHWERVPDEERQRLLVKYNVSPRQLGPKGKRKAADGDSPGVQRRAKVRKIAAVTLGEGRKGQVDEGNPPRKKKATTSYPASSKDLAYPATGMPDLPLDAAPVLDPGLLNPAAGPSHPHQKPPRSPRRLTEIDEDDDRSGSEDTND